MRMGGWQAWTVSAKNRQSHLRSIHIYSNKCANILVVLRTRNGGWKSAEIVHVQAGIERAQLWFFSETPRQNRPVRETMDACVWHPIEDDHASVNWPLIYWPFNGMPDEMCGILLNFYFIKSLIKINNCRVYMRYASKNLANGFEFWKIAETEWNAGISQHSLFSFWDSIARASSML